MASNCRLDDLFGKLLPLYANLPPGCGANIQSYFIYFLFNDMVMCHKVLQFDIRFIIQKTVITSVMAARGQGSGFKGAVGWVCERMPMTSVFS